MLSHPSGSDIVCFVVHKPFPDASADFEPLQRIEHANADLLEPLLHAPIEVALHGPTAGIGADHLAEHRDTAAVDLVDAPRDVGKFRHFAPVVLADLGLRQVSLARRMYNSM